MFTVSSAEFQQNCEAYQDKALEEPVVIILDSGAKLIMIAAEEYYRLTQRGLDAISGSEMEPGQTD